MTFLKLQNSNTSFRKIHKSSSNNGHPWLPDSCQKNFYAAQYRQLSATDCTTSCLMAWIDSHKHNLQHLYFPSAPQNQSEPVWDSLCRPCPTASKQVLGEIQLCWKQRPCLWRGMASSPSFHITPYLCQTLESTAKRLEEGQKVHCKIHDKLRLRLGFTSKTSQSIIENNLSYHNRPVNYLHLL